MGSPVKVTVVGAGSATFSMGLVRDLCLSENLAGSHVTFMDIAEDRLEVIHRLAERYITELDGKLTFERTTNLANALVDADFVINTAGAEYAHWEERRALPRKHGFYGGPGFYVNYDNLSLMLGVAREIERICPSAWLIQSGNPVYEGTTLIARETRVKIIGLCHGHYGYISVADVMGLNPDRITWTAPGLNHTIWLSEFRYDGEDAYPLLEGWIETSAEEYWRSRQEHPERYGLEDHMSRAVIDMYRRFGLLPIGDTTRGGGWWYKRDLDARVHWYGPTGGFGSELHNPPFIAQHNARIQQVRDVAQDPSRSVLEAFPPVKTREQQVPIIDALTNDVAAKFQINVLNHGAVPGIPDDVAAEFPAYIDKGGIHRLQVTPLPRKIMIEVIQPMILSMEWELEAFLTGDRDMLLDGMLMLTTFQSGGHAASYEQTAALLDDMLSQPFNRAMAEHFRERNPAWARVLRRS